jgi:Fe-S cluster assembly protein SufD
VGGQRAITDFRLQPELRVAHDTAHVTHGAALGHLDPEQLLYVCARGLSPERAKDLLIAGFLAWP